MSIITIHNDTLTKLVFCYSFAENTYYYVYSSTYSPNFLFFDIKQTLQYLHKKHFMWRKEFDTIFKMLAEDFDNNPECKHYKTDTFLELGDIFKYLYQRHPIWKKEIELISKMLTNGLSRNSQYVANEHCYLKVFQPSDYLEAKVKAC